MIKELEEKNHKNRISKILAGLTIITNLFVSIPIASFAEKEQLNMNISNISGMNNISNTINENTTGKTNIENNKLEDNEEKVPALAPIAAYSVIGKYISTSLTGPNDAGNATSGTVSGNGNAKIEKCDPNNGGYEAVFTSGTTGRQFKEYRQNIPGWNSKYNISGVNCQWTSECGLVSCMIVGSGYSQDANFENATNILVNELGGSTVHSVFLSRWIGHWKPCVSYWMTSVQKRQPSGRNLEGRDSTMTPLRTSKRMTARQ